MSLETNFTITAACSCNNFTFTETTGDYNVSSNPTGWGAPNIAHTDVDASTLTVTFPSGTTASIDLLADINAGKGFTKEITLSDLGLEPADILEPGVWKFTWANVDDDTATTYSTDVEIFVWCSYKKCLKTKLLGYTESSCCGACADKAHEEISRIQVLLSALEEAASCKDAARFTKIAAKLDVLCGTSSDCGCS